jgi:hypothetical protein
MFNDVKTKIFLDILTQKNALHNFFIYSKIT